MLDLQATVGNQAVASVLRTVQRQPKTPTPRMTAGWENADTAADGGPGWNAAPRENVEGTGIRRIPVDDIAAGNQLKWSQDYGGKDDAASEKNRTTETAAGRAIVLKPAGLNVNSPIDVLLHLHGYTSRRWDPAAGWRQSKVAITKDGKSYKPVRDIDQDRIAQQMATVTKTNPQTLGILPQGVGHSFFGADFVPRTYIDEVVKRLQQIKELPAPTSGSLQTNLTLSAHSGGGHTVRKALRAELDAAKAAAKAAKSGKAPASTGAATPVLNPTQVVLFEAINNSTELSTVKEWVYMHLNRTRDALLAANNPISKAMIIAGCPTLRAYRSRDGYKNAYDGLDQAIQAWFTAPSLGGKLSTVEKDLLRDRFRVEVLHGVTNKAKGLSGHEQVVGGLGTAEQGPLADALAARVDPSSSKLLKGPPPKTPTTPGKGSGSTTTSPTKASGSPSGTGRLTSAVATAEPAISFGSRARRDTVAASSLTLLGGILRTAGISGATISSTARTPADQARAMYQNLVGSGKGQGVEGQRRLYGSGGDKVIDTFVQLRDDGKTGAEIQAGMVARIEALSPGTVSKHLADPTKLNVLDVAPSSLGDAAAVARFEAAARALLGGGVERLLTPADSDPAEHLEIKPTGGGSGGGSASTTQPVGAPGPVKTPERAETQAPAGTQPPAGGDTTSTGSAADKRAFILDVTRSTLELLPRKQRDRFENIPWNDQDYPGAKMKIKDTSEENLNKWRSTPGYEVFSIKKKTKDGPVDVWYLRGTHQAEAAALLLALSRVRPGGGERRVNTGKDAILTQKQFRRDPVAFDEYIIGQLVDTPGEKKDERRKMLNKHAAPQFVAMREAAAKDGVSLSIGNSFRDRKRAEKAAKGKDNTAAVASYSPHSLGLAMDLNLRTRSLRDVDEVTTRMTNTIKLLGAPAYKWMFEHGAAYGFYQYRNEPWHWEYNPPGFAEKFWADNPDLAPGAEEPKKA